MRNRFCILRGRSEVVKNDRPLKRSLFGMHTIRTCLCLVLMLGWMEHPSWAQNDSVFQSRLDRAMARVQQNADSVAQAALQILDDGAQGEIKARALAVAGEAFQGTGALDISVKNFLEAITIADSAGYADVLGSALNGLGITYYLLNDHAKSEHYILRAADVKKAMGDYTLYTVILTNLAGLYFYQQRYDEALGLLRAAEQELIQKGEERYLTTLYNSLGGLHQTAYDQLDSAAYYYLKSIALGERFEMNAGLISAWHNLSEVHLKQGRATDALNDINKAEQLALESSNDRYLITVYGTRALIHREMRNFEFALEDKQKELEYTNKVFETDRQRAIEELDIRYQTLEKEKQLRIGEEQLTKERAKRSLIVFILILTVVLGASGSLLFWQRRRSEKQFAAAKAKILANLVHEIRTPLTLITAPVAEISRDAELAQKHGSRIALIRRQTDRLVRLVTELLDASKTERAAYTVVHEFGNPAAQLTDLLASFSDALAERNQTLDLRLPEAEAWVSYPVNAFELSVNNLVSNANKYGDANTPVRVELQVEAGWLILNVASSGKPILQAQHGLLFERFGRLPEHAMQTGSGIGLSTVKEVAELAGGSIAVTSSEAQLNVFTVKLPVEQHHPRSENQIHDTNKPTVVLAEDDGDLLRYTASVLSEKFTVFEASNGAVAHALILEHLPDLVITDVVMPEADGFELLARLRGDALTNAIPVVVFSSRSSLDARLSALGFGADAYLPKPFDPSELLYMASNLVERMQLQAGRYASEPAATAEERLWSEHAFVNDATQIVLANLDNSDFSIERFGEELNLSRSQLHRKLIQLTGLSASHFLRKVRIEKAKDLLLERRLSVSEIAYATGFNSPSYFTRSFSESEGMSPTDFSRLAE